MDNEAPRYADWIPEAGGYVANGKVVSKSPVYDENGKLKLNVDTSTFGTTQPQNTATPVAQPQAQPQVANTVAGNVGVQTANIVGSDTDANAATTKIGSMTTLENNLGKAQDSIISSPATRSSITGDAILTPEDEVNKEYQDAVARGDLQGQINALVKASRINGQDYSTEIQELTKERQKKIQNIDDQYLQRLNEAKYQGDLTGDYSEYNRLRQEQGAWRDAVGYKDAMRSMYENEIQEIDLDYKSTLWQVCTDISNQLIQALPGILNFQYDPYQDTALQVAQGYATSRVKEQMNASGMYYSSMTQNAIAKAVAELVPVYQKMAKEEAIQNFNLLQQTATFLMDVEKTQFDMWRSQIELQWDQAEQKRKAQDQAIQNANARGYYTNEEAALFGIEPGSPSYESRTRALDKQEQIEAEQRALQQKIALAQIEAELQVQVYERQQRIASKYKTVSGNSSGSGIKVTIDEDGNAKYEYTGQAALDYIRGEGTGNTPTDVVVDENGNVINVGLDKSLKDEISSLKTGDTWDANKIKSFLAKQEIQDLPTNQKLILFDELTDQYLIPTIEENAKAFESGNKDQTVAALDKSIGEIRQYADWMKTLGLESNADQISDTKIGPVGRATGALINQIDLSSDKFNNKAWWFWETNTGAKEDAKQYIVDKFDKSGNAILLRTADNFYQYRKSNEKNSTNKNSSQAGKPGYIYDSVNDRWVPQVLSD